MVAEALFVRDPREIPFLHSQLKQILSLADKVSRSVTTQEDDDFGFMAINFLYKQIQHAESLLALVPRRDAGLIARTMIDGLYQLLWASQAPEERSKLWRSFSIIHDWRRIQGQLKLGIPVDGQHIHRIEALLKVLDGPHRKLKSNQVDPYHKTWRGPIKLSQMADVVGRELYDGPYAELSDWEHWGVSGIGESITRERNSLIVDTDSDRVADISLLAAFECLFKTLGVADIHFSLNITDALNTIGENFKKTLDSFYEK